MAHSDDSVSLSLFLFLSFFLSFFGEYYPLSQSCRDDIRTDTCACGAPGPRKPVHMEKKDGGGGSLHKRFITNVSNPLLHCQGDVIKHTL